MKLRDALELLREIPAGAESCLVYLACGFTPLHLKTLLLAEIWRTSRKRAEVQLGPYGDLNLSLKNSQASGAEAVIVVVEWSDLDPRLGLRRLGGWSPALFPDILDTVGQRIVELQRLVVEVSATIPVILSPPTLPLPPISFTSRNQAGAFELELRSLSAALGARLAQLPNVRVLNDSGLGRFSIPGERLDVRSDLLTGFPYRLSHAAAMAGAFARLISDPVPKKGLITDLDNTLWRGILGEVGVDGIAWTLDAGAQIHGLYQQLLAALAGRGILIAAASKNDPSAVSAALERTDLIVTKDVLLPVEASWEPKSRSVARILRAWNVSADAVVFVDDSAMELAEVAASHPGIQCLHFPTYDDQGAYDLLQELRDQFAKARILEEDFLRAASVRTSSDDSPIAPWPHPEDFLSQAQPELSFSYPKSGVDARALELINKTNQFNLNGRRSTHAALLRHLQRPDTFMMVASYRDRYGPLGKIAVMCGSLCHRKLQIDTWVMSCRAFSRLIEHRCLEELFARFGPNEIAFDFQPTERNGPFREFLTQLLGEAPTPGCALKRADFETRALERPRVQLEVARV